jgi:carbamoyltransferase
MSLILGISCFYHDSAASLVKDGKVVFAIQEERFTRKKHDPSFPFESIKYIFKQLDISYEDLDAIVYYEKPLLKFERILQLIHKFIPLTRKQFCESMPVWVKQKLFFKKHFWSLIEESHGGKLKRRPPLLFSEHHLSHAASTFYPSGFESAAIMTLDGVGEWASLSLGVGCGKDIKFMEQIEFPHSLGMLYSAFTYFLGFKVNSGEYKLMGLAPYGNPESDRTKKYIELIKEHLIHINDTGHFLLNLPNFDYQHSMRMCNIQKWERIFDIKTRVDGDPIRQEHMDLAIAIQIVTEEVVLKLAKHLRDISGEKNLVLSGGVALNCVANGKLKRDGIFENIWIQPAAGDAGGALGAALAAHYIYFENNRDVDASYMQNAFLGPSFSNEQIESFLVANGIQYHKFNDQDLITESAKLIADGNVLGWFQGHMEWGPRALGHRSIIADPRNEEMQKQLNLKIKFRESFRPFAPIMTEACNREYFNDETPGPYMLFVTPLAEKFRHPKPEGYDQMELSEKLYFKRSDLPAITHIDYTARIQTVNEKSDARMHQLLCEFGKLSGYEMLINTSFNVRGEPIVLSPRHAFLTFMQTHMDYLVLGNFLLKKTEQKDYDNHELWQREFQKD